MGYDDRTLAPTNDKKDLLNRLRRIEGQVRGIQQMVEDDRYCIDILTQLAAARAALYNIGLTLLENHTRHCLANALRSEPGDCDAHDPARGAHDYVNELVEVLARFAR